MDSILELLCQRALTGPKDPEVRVKVIAQKVLLDLTLKHIFANVASIGSVQTIEAYVESIEDIDTQTDQSYQ